MALDSKPEVGTRVHVEFDGIVEPDMGSGMKGWQVVVADEVSEDVYAASHIHLINWQSDAVTITEIPSAEPEWWPPVVGDVFENTRTGSRYMVTENGIKSTSGMSFDEEAFGHEQGLWELLVSGDTRDEDIIDCVNA